GLTGNFPSDVTASSPSERTFKTKHGTSSTMKVDGINKGRQEKKAAEKAAREEAERLAAEAFEDGLSDHEALLEAHGEIERLNVQIKALEANDTAKELVKQINIRQGLESQLSRAMV